MNVINIIHNKAIEFADEAKALVKEHFLERVNVKAYLSPNGILLMEEMEKVV